jgi:methanogenic corrinoid protein MtbC1
LAIEGAFPIKNTNKTAVLFLPEGELHELCLLFMHYLLKVRGIKVYYLGANVPVNDVIYVVDAKNPTFIYSHLTALLKNFNLEKFFLYLNNKLPNSKIIISGKLIQEYKKKVPKCIEFKKSLNEAIDFINNI